MSDGQFAYDPFTGVEYAFQADPANVGVQYFSTDPALGLTLGKPVANYDKYKNEILPIVFPKAQQTSLPVYVFWFGELLGVDPQGNLLHGGSFSSADEALNALVGSGYEAIAYWSGRFLYVGQGTASPVADAAMPMSEIPIRPAVAQAGLSPLSASSGWTWLIAAGAVFLLVAASRPKKSPRG